MISNDPNYTTMETETLPIGDVLIKTDEGKDVLIVERKSLKDLLASIKDGRYEEQSHRLKNASGFAPHNVFYIIEGMFSTLRTPLEKKLIISVMTSLAYFKGFSIIRTSGLQETADVLIQMADKIDRNFMKGVLPWYLSRPSLSSSSSGISTCPTNEIVEVPSIENTEGVSGGISGGEPAYSGFVKKVKKENITPENMGEIMLCQIPGISTLYAQAILKAFGGFSQLMKGIKDGTAKFENITYESKGKQRKIPKNCGEDIGKFLGKI
jgi:ERCC4-type nuclease